MVAVGPLIAPYEVDFGESWAEVAGLPRKVKYVVATLPYSNVYFAKAYPFERLESLLDGIQTAFAYLGGVTDRVPCRVHTAHPFLISLGIPTRRRYGIRP